MTKHITSDKCVGCLACENICPVGAISHDVSTGFIRPVVDESICINCGLCLKACPKDSSPEKSGFLQHAYAVKHKDLDVLAKSTSGGVFSSIADYILNNGGAIYGCAVVDKQVQHIRVECDYSSMRGSKYVQSNLKDAHKKIASDLKNGKNVLFTGTPCQCESVRKFLSASNIKAEKLLLVDFVCHGVSSPLLFEQYVSFCEERAGKTLSNHLFRTKFNGWVSHVEENIWTDGTKDHSTYESQLFKGIFHSLLGTNESCFECRFASLNRPSDITIADFWGIKDTHPELFDSNGVSFVMINSEKGEQAFADCQNIYKHDVAITDTKNPHLYAPVSKPQKYDRFWRDYHKKGFKHIVKKYYCGGKLYRFLSDTYHKLRGR